MYAFYELIVDRSFRKTRVKSVYLHNGMNGECLNKDVLPEMDFVMLLIIIVCHQET